VRFIHGYVPGGSADITARLIGQWLSDRLGQPFIVESRPGAGSNIGTEAVVRANPDGYTILLVAPANAINATLYERLPYNFIQDIAPVAGLIRFPNVMEVNPSVPATTVPEFIAYAKANPGRINMASSGNGSTIHMSGELFKMMTGITMVHVPYRGAAPALTDMIGGQVQVMFDNAPNVMPQVKAGRLRALGQSGPTRSPIAADLPTVAEAGVPGYSAPTWSGLIGPAGLPKPIVDKLNAAVNRAIKTEAFVARFGTIGDEPAGGSPEEFAQNIARDSAKWKDVVDRSGAKLD